VSDPSKFDCQACGACCAVSAEWPRFTLESDEDIARIPLELIADSEAGMACDEDGRCAALDGMIGTWTRCRIHAVRPIVCRDCQPGDPECLEARELHGIE
jgi:hypothetical protein